MTPFPRDDMGDPEDEYDPDFPEGEAFDHPGSILYFDVPDLRAAHEELVRRGVAFDSAPHLIADLGARELWMAFFKDSEGNQLALMSEIAKS